MIERLIAKYGVLPLAICACVLIIVLYFAAVLGVSKLKGWLNERRADRAEQALLIEKAKTKTLKADLKQTDNAGKIAADTVAQQDRKAKDQRQRTAEYVEVINERIIKVPVAVLPADDGVVRQAVHKARSRAVAAQDRLLGTPGY
jgi:outer membrane murein-binding lipoprotein Lpp